MNKAELVTAIAEKADVSKRDAEASLKAFTEVVVEEVTETAVADTVQVTEVVAE